MKSSLFGSSRPMAWRTTSRCLGMVEVAHDLGDAEDAHGEHREVDAVGQERQAEGHALLAGLEVGADGGEQHADQDHGDRLEDRAARQHDGEDEAHDHEREILGRAEDQGEPGERRAERRDDERRHRAGEERADGRDAERHAGAALAGHLVAVERGDHGGRLAGMLTRIAVVEPPYWAP